MMVPLSQKVIGVISHQLLQSPTFHPQIQPRSALHRSSSAILAGPPELRSATPTFPSQHNGHRPASLATLESPSSTVSAHSPPKQNHLPPIIHSDQAFDHPQFPSPSSSRNPHSTKPADHHPASSSTIPHSPPKRVISDADRAAIFRWASKEQAHESATFHGRRQKRTIFASSYGEALDVTRSDWLGEAGHSHTRSSRFRLQLPIDADKAAATGKRKNRPRLKLTKHDLKLVSNTEEILVPIRLEIEIEHWKLRDTFTWNLKEPVVTPEQFAVHLCEDLILPIQHFSGPIVSAIKEQLEEYKLHENFEGHLASRLSVPPEEEEPTGADPGTSYLPPDHPQPTSDLQQQQKEEAWWAEWRQRIMAIDDQTELKPDLTTDLPRGPKRPKLDRPSLLPTATQSSIRSRLIDYNDQNFRPETAEAIPLSSDLRDDELRIPINLDIISGNIHLTDRFEWEISELNNSPEEFVEVYANDLGLGGEFKTAIAHSIREQIETYVKSLALVEHTNGYPVPNDELRYAFLQRVTDPIRTGQVDDFTPFLNLLNAEELDRQEKEHDREARRKRRQTRSRRGITLPDRESQRTVRSIVPIQGLKMVLPYQNENEDLIVPIQPVAEPFAIEESAVEIPEPSELPPKKHIPVSKEVQIPDSQLGTPNKATGSRVSRRLRGATADVAPAGTPPKTTESNPTVEKDDAPTPSNAGTPVPSASNKKTNNKADPSSNANASKKPTPAGSRTRGGGGGVNWESLGLHDPMVDGVWHCSNCGCPESIAVGRRKGMGGKDTLCGECGRYLHRYKRNRPTLYNTSADYHTSLKLEADKAKQAIADQEIVRKDKNKAENQNLPASLNSKKRKKDGRTGLLLKSEQLRRSEDRAGSVASSTKSAASRESSPVASVRSTTNGGSEKPVPKKRSRIQTSSEAPPPSTRAQKSISKTMIIDSPEQSNSPDSNSPTNARSQSTSTPQPTKPARVRSRRSSTKTAEKNKKGSAKNEDGPDRPAGSKSPPVMGTRQENQKKKEPRSKDSSEKTKNGSKTPEESQAKSVTHPGSRSGSISGSVGGGKSLRSEPRRSMTNGRVPPPISAALKFEPPAWMLAAREKIRADWPSDQVELIPRPKRDVLAPGQPPVIVGCDWRIKCMDCPGKLYTVGPGESFTNFDVHLKNRQHRQKVEDRLKGLKQQSQEISPTGSTHSQPGISPTASLNPQASSSTTLNAKQHPQLSPTDGSQHSQLSPTASFHRRDSHAGSQASPAEHNSYLNGHNSRRPSGASPIVFDSQYQHMMGERPASSYPDPVSFAEPARSPEDPGRPHSLPPITTTLAAAESATQDQADPPPGVNSEAPLEGPSAPPAPSSLDGVAIQENNDEAGPSHLPARPLPRPRPPFADPCWRGSAREADPRNARLPVSASAVLSGEGGPGSAPSSSAARAPSGLPGPAHAALPQPMWHPPPPPPSALPAANALPPHPQPHPHHTLVHPLPKKPTFE
ncbi:hypothetical protein PtB15_1B316 [Puccinia triticina]|nr:hypothetical protein PtB15_1B316 [Puccinia triticina]